jgi:beta-lactamase regulating signal transducer with metallopeptidase domain
MIFSGFLELLLSLTLQSSLILMLASVLSGRAKTSDAADRYWSRSHAYILLLCLAAFLLPHVRLMHPDAMVTVLNSRTGESIFRSVEPGISGMWLIGVVCLSVVTVWSLCRMTILLRNATDISSQFLLPGQSLICDNTRLQLAGLRVRIVSSEDWAIPFCWQLHSPVIFLPAALLSFPAAELDSILRHELAHLRSHHPFQLFLQRLVEVFFWFNPLVWMTSREAAIQRELASDRRANESASQVASFLRGMIRVSDSCMLLSSRLAAGMGFTGEGRSMIQRRVDQLMSVDWGRCSDAIKTAPSSSLLTITAIAVSLVWIPLNADATGRTILSPWPEATAAMLHELGFSVRDYEVDRHRLLEHEHEAR